MNIPKEKWRKSQQTDNKISKICEKKHSVHFFFMVVSIQVASEICFLYYEPIKSINKHLIFSKFPCDPFSGLEGYRQMNYRPHQYILSQSLVCNNITNYVKYCSYL